MEETYKKWQQVKKGGELGPGGLYMVPWTCVVAL